MQARRKNWQPKRGRGGRGVWGEFRRARAGMSVHLRLPDEGRTPKAKFSLQFPICARHQKFF